uniref:Fucosyltransferase n=1 Tax=Steinernema glaseri TaxID=37863 RepID=A0A1I7ZJV7_9BILA
MMRNRLKSLGLAILVCCGIYVMYFSFPGAERLSKSTVFTLVPANSIVKDEIADPTPTETSAPQEKIILLWTTIFQNKEPPSDSCSDLPGQCHFTNNRSLLSEAHAVLFHGDDIDKNDLPERTSYEQRFVFWTMESTFMSFNERFTGKLPLNFFNWTMTVSRESDIHHPYGGYWLSPEIVKEKHITPENLHFTEDEFQWDKRKKAIFWLVSNCNTVSRRELAVQRLSKYIPVTISGKCGTGFCEGDCNKQIPGYYFYMALENAICNDYVTEKYWDRYKYLSVPIVMRRRIYEKIIPPGSFIAMDDFSSPEAMGKHLHYLMKNRTAYMEYFNWRKKGWTHVYSAEGYHLGPCRLCERLYETDVERKTYSDVNKWFSKTLNCERSQFARNWV